MKKLVYPFTFDEWKKANHKKIKWCKKIAKEIKNDIQLKLFE
jgi:hypothetical protein